MAGWKSLWGLKSSDHLQLVRQVILTNPASSVTRGCSQVLRSEQDAMLLPWVPQDAVLGHSAVGAALMHCGWSGIVEALSHAKPVGALPH